MVLLIDNYDSFTYNLRDYILQLGLSCGVIRNDEMSLEEIAALEFTSAVISPGPRTPKEAGVTMNFIKRFHKTKPILGICLGHQAIGEFFGAKLVKTKPVHGKTSVITHVEHYLFKDLPDDLEVMRYHSLMLEEVEKTELKVIARTKENEVMALSHPTLKIAGVQFHPESILTPSGLQMLKNWFDAIGQH
jgi:anthranilate synthase/aminodeoxychorismate synthase-like glutamine amidotransferase